MILVNVESASSILKLDDKTRKVLKVLSKNEYVRLGQFVQVLSIMDFDNWDFFDNSIDQYTISSKDRYLLPPLPPTLSKGLSKETPSFLLRRSTDVTLEDRKTIEDDLSKTPEPHGDCQPFPKFEYKGVDGLGDDHEVPTLKPRKKYKKKDETKTNIKERKKHITKKELLDKDVDNLIKKYIEDHNHVYNATDMANELGISYSVARNRVLKFDDRHLTINSAMSIAQKNYNRVKEYIDSHDIYYISDMAEELGLGETAIRRHANKIDPKHKKLGKRRSNIKSFKEKHAESIFNYIALSEEDEFRKNWLDGAIKHYAEEKHIAKASILNPVYKDLKEKYGIVLSQKGKDYLYEHKFTPVEDYPIPSPYELIILDPDVFSISQGLIVDRYGQANFNFNQ